MTEPHDHALDGQLHADCPMCDEIRARLDTDRRIRPVEAAQHAEIEKYADLVERLKHYRHEHEGGPL